MVRQWWGKLREFLTPLVTAVLIGVPVVALKIIDAPLDVVNGTVSPAVNAWAGLIFGIGMGIYAIWRMVIKYGTQVVKRELEEPERNPDGSQYKNLYTGIRDMRDDFMGEMRSNHIENAARLRRIEDAIRRMEAKIEGKVGERQ